MAFLLMGAAITSIGVKGWDAEKVVAIYILAMLAFLVLVAWL